MKARTPKVPAGIKAVRRHNLLGARRCRRCPLCTLAGQCVDPALKSGRCGDWVWYMLGRKQFRRLWVKPRDPRTPSQRQWRARLGAASKNYSQTLSDEQQDACVVAGAKVQSRPRLGQSGLLTGQQYWVGKECARNARERVRNAETHVKSLQTLGISRPTWEPHRGISGAPPGHRRPDTRRGGNHAGRRRNGECRTERLRAALELPQDQAITPSTWPQFRSAIGTRRQQVSFGVLTAKLCRSCPVGRRLLWRKRRGSTGRRAIESSRQRRNGSGIPPSRASRPTMSGGGDSD
jgi:hypothetical protein